MEVNDPEVSVTHGDVPESAKQYAAEKINQLPGTRGPYRLRPLAPESRP